MLIWNTNAATTGAFGIGFYVFTGAVWERLNTGAAIGDEDWYEEGTTTPPNDINDDIFTNGRVGINTDALADRQLNISATDMVNIVGYFESSATNDDPKIGVEATLIGTGNGIQTGFRNSIFNSGAGWHYGLQTNLSGENAVRFYGHDISISGDANALIYGQELT